MEYIDAACRNHWKGMITAKDIPLGVIRGVVRSHSNIKLMQYRKNDNIKGVNDIGIGVV